MTQDFITAVEPIRNQYVNGYATWLAEKARAYPQGAGEYLFEIQAQTNFARKLCRVDFVSAPGDNAPPHEYSLKSMLGFTPMSDRIDGVEVQLNPFRWDSAVVEIPGAIWDRDKVIEWFNRWFGFNGKTPWVTVRDKPSGVLHICAWVEPGMLRIDFGSAPAEALAELIPIARDSGAQLMSIRDASQMAARPDAGHVIG